MLSILFTSVFALATGFTNVAAFGGTATGNSISDHPMLIAQGDDNGGASVYGIPPLLPQGDDNGGA